MLVLLALLIEAIYIYVVPPWQGPDEPRHMEYALLLARDVPPGSPAGLAIQRELIASMEAHQFWRYGYAINPYDPAHPPQTLDDIWPGHAHQTHQPPLYYLLAGRLLRFIPQAGIEAQMYLLRWFSALCGAGVVLIAWFASRHFFSAGMSFAIASFIALLPMHAFINATVSNDNLTSLFTAAIFLVGARSLREGLTPARFLGMSAAGALAMLTKRTGFIAPAAVLLLSAGALWPAVRRRAEGRFSGRRALLILLLVLCGCVLIFLALLTIGREAVAAAWRFFHLPPDVIELFSSGAYAEAIRKTPYLYYSRVVFESFFARFGWLNIRLGEGWYVLLMAVCLLAGAGLVAGLLRLRRPNAGPERDLFRPLCVYLLTAAAGYLLIIGKELLFLSYRFGVVPQGRYLFPAVIPLATLFVWGLSALIPARHHRTAGRAGLALWAAFGIICLVGYVIPYYYHA